MENEIRTKDLYLASLLYAETDHFLRMKREGRTCWFIFARERKTEQLVSSYWSGKAYCNAKLFVDAIRTLKDMVFAEV